MNKFALITAGAVLFSLSAASTAVAVGGNCRPWACGMNGPSLNGIQHIETDGVVEKRRSQALSNETPKARDKIKLNQQSSAD